MLGPETIRNISDVAAYRAAEEERKPLPVWRGSEEQDCRQLPFLGDYCPVGYRPATFRDLNEEGNVALPYEQSVVLLVRFGYRAAGDIVDLLMDATGWDKSGPALSFEDFCALAGGGYWAIVEEGQFQIVARLYVKDPSAPGHDAPSYEDVECSECLTVHNDLEECDLDYCADCSKDVPYGHICEGAYEYCHGCDDGIAEGDAHVIEFFKWPVMYRDAGESGVLCDKCYESEGPNVDAAYEGDVYGEGNLDDRDPIEVYGTPEHEAWLLECERNEP